MERYVSMRGKSSEQESNEVIHRNILADSVCRGEGTKTTGDSKDDSQQRQVSQPVQIASHSWEAPVIVHGDLVHYTSVIVEQVRTCM